MIRKKAICLKRLQGAVALFLILAFLTPLSPGQFPSAEALSSTVVISQIYGAGGNTGAIYANDFVELYNRGNSPASLSGWSVQYASATGTGSFSGNPVTSLSGMLAPGQYYLVKMAGGAAGAPLPAPDTTGTINLSGSAGKVALVNTTAGLTCNGGSTPCSSEQLVQIVDLVGYGGANFYEGTGPAPALSTTTADLRKSGGCTESDTNSTDFEAGAPNPRNTASPTSLCSAENPPAVASTIPANGATGIAVNANISITFSEPVMVSMPPGTAWIICTSSGNHPAQISGGPTTFTLDPDTDFGNNETCTLTIPADSVSDQDTNDPPDTMAQAYSISFSTALPCGGAYTPIYDIQGSGASAAITGAVSTQGVVVGDYEGASPNLGGFYLQDLTGDGNAATSDGIFVYDSSSNKVNLGDVVRVDGTAAEYQGQTQVNASAITTCSTGASVNPDDVTLPLPSSDYLERYEGMLVRLPQTLYVTEHYLLGRFGMVIMSSSARLRQPTNVVPPGAPALALQASNALNRIIIDDSLNDQDPDPILFGDNGLPLSAANTLRGGDSAAGITGVMTYGWAGNSASPNAYRVRPVSALGASLPDFQPANPRPTALPDPGGTLKVAGMNLLNFFNTFGTACTEGVGGAATDCRGAENQAEFDRQLPKIIAAIRATGADVVGVTELENDGYGSTSAIQDLVDMLNAATASDEYAFINADAATGQVNALGTDAIKVGLIYKPARVTPVGSTAVLNTTEFVNGGDSGARNRPALAQAFREVASGEQFVISINHLKSKGSACALPDAGDGQGNCNAVRTNAATLLASWLASDPTGTGEKDMLIVGDLNSYAMEDPITALKNAGYTNLVNKYSGEYAYSYAFDGQWGYLDHALATTSMARQVTRVVEYHINADEPSVLDYNTNFKSASQLSSLYSADQYRAADHDPIVIGLNLGKSVQFSLYQPLVTNNQ